VTLISQLSPHQTQSGCQSGRIVSKARFLILAATFAAATLASPLAWSQGQPQRIEITAKRFSYSPGEITVKKGQPVTIALKSEDVAHGLRIRELGVDMKVKAGETAEVTFTPDKVGDFTGHCSVFCGSGHGSMTITVHVVA
jgi:cytochrome c oxidase subunit 2